MSRLIVNGVEVDLEKIAKETKGKAKNAETRERREVFAGDALEISQLSADVDIQPSGKDEITIVATGPADVVDQLEISKSEGMIYVSGRANDNNITITQNVNFGNNRGHIGNVIAGNVSSIGRFGGVTVISGDDVIINTGGDNDAKLSLKNTAPLYTELSFSGITGDITIGDLQADVNLDLSGQNFVQIATVRHLDLDSSGQCEVIAEEITGSANLDISGNAKIELRKGYVEKLAVDASGMGKVDARITAKCANLNASGMCNIYVKEVTGRCHKRSSGMSHIAVG